MEKYIWVKYLDYSRLSLREQALVILCAASTLLFIWIYLYLPVHKDAGDLSQSAARMKTEVYQLKEKQVQKQKAAEGSLTTLDHPLETPKALRLANLLEGFNQAAHSEEIDLQQIQVKTTKEQGPFQVYPIFLDLRAGFTQAGNFVQKVSTLPALLQIQSLRLEADPEDASAVFMTLSMNFYQEKEATQ